MTSQHAQKLAKFGDVVSEISERTDTRTHEHSHHNTSQPLGEEGGEVAKVPVSWKLPCINTTNQAHRYTNVDITRGF